MDLSSFIILKTIIGSRAYGLATEASDTDRRGIYLPPADLHWSLTPIPEQLENDEAQECYWELEKFLRLALKANPNILECLFSPLVEYATPLAVELLAMRHVFLSKRVHQTYNNYVLSQFKKQQRHIDDTNQVNFKHAMHLIRLLLTGIHILQHNDLQVRLPDQHREQLLAIKQGKRTWQEINAWRLELHGELDAAYEKTTLPDHPNHEAANAYLLKARRSML
jgi:predicted nucleotidyltransferase